MSDVILFDVDNTLLDTGKLMQESINPALQEVLAVNDQEFEKVRQQYHQTLKKSTQFDPDSYITAFADYFEANRQQLVKVFANPTNYLASIFSEVESVLQLLQSSHTLGIYSEGVVSWQRKKLELSGLIKFFDPNKMYISENKIRDEYVSSVPESVIVDDRLPVIQFLQTKTHVRPVWLNRELGPEVGAIYCETIMSLSELPDLLSSN